MKWPDGVRQGPLDNNQQDYATQVLRAMQLQHRSPTHLDAQIGLGIQVDDYTRPEFWTLRKGSLWQSWAQAGPVAAQYSYVNFQGAPGTLAVIESLIITNISGAAFAVQMGMALQDAGAVVPSTPRDDRGWATSSACNVEQGTAAAPINPIGGLLYVPNNTSTVIPVEIVVTSATKGASPFAVFKVVSTAVNVRLDVTMQWRERALLPSEA